MSNRTSRVLGVLASCALIGGIWIAGGNVRLVAAPPPPWPPKPVPPNVIVVTTTADNFNPFDQVVSLREAVWVANIDGKATKIVLSKEQTYIINKCAGGADEDANASGDLDYTAAGILTIEGNGSEVHNACRGQRVLHSLNDKGWLVIKNLTITGGNVATGVDGSGLLSHSHTELIEVLVTENSGGAAVDVSGVGYKSMGKLLNSEITGNTASGLSLSGDSPVFGDGSFVVASSKVLQNAGSGIHLSHVEMTVKDSQIAANGGDGIDGVDGSIAIHGSQVQLNDGWGVRNTGNGPLGFPLTVTTTSVAGNALNGIECSECGSLLVSHSEVTGNGGDGVYFRVHYEAAPATIEASTIAGNQSGGLELEDTSFDTSEGPPVAEVRESTIAGNSAGSSQVGGGIHALGVDLTITNSTISGNTAASGGGILVDSVHESGLDGSLTLQHVTVAGNVAASGANLLRAKGTLSSFASVVALGSGGGTDCDGTSGILASTGYNFDGDGSCGFGAGPGDVSAGGNPQLGALGANGGPTETRLPNSGSPLIDAVPPNACTLLADQRGISRPQGSGCEIGAVEAQP